MNIQHDRVYLISNGFCVEATKESLKSWVEFIVAMGGVPQIEIERDGNE